MRITTVLSVARATEGNKQNVKQKKSTANTLGIKKWMKYEQMDRIFLGKYWNYHPLKIEKVFFLKKLKISSK